MTVRLYGRDVGNGSLAVVTRGFREVLGGAGLLEGFVALDRSGGSEEDDAPPGALAHDAVFTGNLSHLSAMRIGTRHERHWVTVTPNSTYIPKDLLAAVVALPNPRILSASAWGTTMIGGALGEIGLRYTEDGNTWCTYLDGDKSVEVHTVHHGVSGFAPVPDELDRTRLDYAAGAFRVVHFSTTEGERKGTLELVQAWKLIREHNWLPPKAELLLVLDDHARRALQGRLLDAELPIPDGVRLLPRGNLDSAQMSNLLCHMHVLVAPSRGEGWGLGPAEARACGVVTVTTRTTGHSSGHCDGPGTVAIYQDDELVPIDDGPAALAPAVDPEHIATSLKNACNFWVLLSEEARDAAPAFAREWSWANQLAPLVELLR